MSFVTVFGGSGLLGRHAVRALAQAGHRIRVAVRYPNLAEYLPPMGTVGAIQLMRCNVRNEAAVAAAVHGADAVVNLVGILAESGSQSFNALQREAAGVIAKAASDAGVSRLIQISAIGADADSNAAYARSKGEGEVLAAELFPATTVLRPSLVFGPEDNFFNRFAGLARFAPMLPLVGGGHTRFQPTFAADVGAAITKCIDDPSTAGKTYELGGPATYSFKELMQFVLRETGRSRLLLPMPFWMAAMSSYVLQLLPSPLLTPDQVKLLKKDNVVSDGALTYADLGITPDSVEAVVPNYLWRFRPKGQFQNDVGDKVSGTPAIL